MTIINTRVRHLFGAFAVGAGAALLCAAPALADDFKWPKLMVIGAAGTPTGSFASTNGWAPILQKETGMTVRVVPEDNEVQRYKRLVERRDTVFNSVSANNIRHQIIGAEGYADLDPVPQRILWHHNDTPWAFVVSGSSDLKSLDDLKRGGVRVAENLPASSMVEAVRRGLPEFVGIPAEEADKVLKYVPTGNYGENCRSIVEGKADIAYCSPISSITAEIEGAPGGVRWLPLPHANKEGWTGFLRSSPTLVPGTIEIGVSSARGIEGATSSYVYAMPADADEELAYQLAKWLHVSFDSYKNTHPLAARMSLKLFRDYLDQTPIPIHAGTVRYLREIGAWTEQDDEWNAEAIAKTDRWIAARKAALAEAASTGVKPNFQDETFLKILHKHTDGLDDFRTRL